ncbi:NAD(P)-binding protein [Hypoxylon trugodes]|uniref:NAD(P)-binding protein n=1 Tax=Hypoxylon trugodes TaxID=326681 RepID=UPI00218F245D|nr:NAD(P)-binding protein [Hypoxylon trugodes]KAI1385382.1 NAD(P)-binding protein [Hypoxylon trugodes]
MPSYLVTGASRGLGFEFLRQLSAVPGAVVIGLARDKAATEKKVSAEIGRPNVHVVHGELTDYESLKKAAEDTAKITGGSLDYLIANGGIVSRYSAFKTLYDLADDPKALEEDLLTSYKINTIGQIHLFNLFLPLIKKGEAKKIVALSSGHADYDLIRDFGIVIAGPYTLSKTALNFAIAKYHGEFKNEGILFMSISPGVVETSGHNDPEGLSERELENLGKVGQQFANYAPHFKGAITPEESVRLMLDIINRATVENGYGGTFVSQFGNKQWL